MSFSIPKNSLLRRDLGQIGVEFLQHGLDGLTRVLPHVTTSGWKIEKKHVSSAAKFADANKRQLRLDLGLQLADRSWKVGGLLERRMAPSGVGAIARTISAREHDIAERTLQALSRTLGPARPDTDSSLSALRPTFDERVVAEHLAAHHHLSLDLSEWLATLRRLAEQTYENKALAFGCIVDPAKGGKPPKGARFPRDFVERKKYRALSDAYRTAYLISGHGALLGFFELGRRKARGSRYYPEWCEDLATEARDGKVGLALTRQGDILVLDDGHMTFTYRFGRWQYWNHAHLVDLIRNAARVQKVPPRLLSVVVRDVVSRGPRRVL